MSYEFENKQCDRGVHVMSLLLGMTVGIAGTILFATYNERKFKRVTDKVKGVSENTGEYLVGVEHNMLERADGMVDATRQGVKNASQHTRKAVDAATNTVEDVVDRLADKTHQKIENHLHKTS